MKLITNHIFSFYIILLAIITFNLQLLTAQIVPIYLNDDFSDWDTNDGISDEAEDAAGIDFLHLTASNDADNLLLFIEAANTFKLTESNNIYLYIDTDNDVATGNNTSIPGSDLVVRLGNVSGTFYPATGGSNYLSWQGLQLRSFPTFTNNRFEMAIGRNIMADGNTVFNHATIKITVVNAAPNGDQIPNEGSEFLYTFSDENLPTYTPITFGKTDVNHLRIMSYNTLLNGILNPSQSVSMGKIIQATQPDIITFNECWDVSSAQARNFMNDQIPLGTLAGWYAVKADQGNITVSRYPLIQSWAILSERRLTATLIDLPNNIYQTDIMVINAHLKCCGDGNTQRQEEADAFARFILNLKDNSIGVDIPANTPFILSGDLNLVGDGQQYQTLVTGDIVFSSIYGNGAPLDWDNSDLADARPLNADLPMAYTWRSSGENFVPGRLDYHIYSDSAMDLAKAFVIQTEIMPASRLAAYNLNASDTQNASDHLPVVSDFALALMPGVSAPNLVQAAAKVLVQPNPFKEQLQIDLNTFIPAKTSTLQLQNTTGTIVWQQVLSASETNQTIQLSTSHLPSGIYFLVLINGNVKEVVKVVKR